jgi:hypothetical protein
LNGREKVDRYLIKELLPWVDCNARTNAKLIYGNRMINACSLTSCGLAQLIGRYAVIHRPFGFTNICMMIKGQRFNATGDMAMCLIPAMTTGQLPIDESLAMTVSLQFNY